MVESPPPSLASLAVAGLGGKQDTDIASQAGTSLVARSDAKFHMGSHEDYTFSSAFERNSAAGSDGSAGSNSDRSASGRHKSGGGCGGADCRACDKPKLKGFPYCASHKVTYQACERSAKRVDAKTKEFVDEQQAAAFDDIFGKGREPPPNMALANKVLLDYETQFPFQAGKSTQKRGSLDLTRFVSAHGARQSKEEVSATPMWEEEIFMSQMHQLRSWTHAYSRDVWKTLFSAPGAETDHGGYRGAARVRIPSNMIGADKRENRSGEYEDRRLEHMSKSQKNMSQDMVENMLAQTARGFTHLGSGSSSSALWHTLEASSIVARPGSLACGVQDKGATGSQKDVLLHLFDLQ